MATQLPISIYKNTIINTLLKNDKIVKALNYDFPNFLELGEVENPSNLVYQNIFPYKHVPKIQEDAKTFITMSFAIQWDKKNKQTLRGVDLYIYVFTHQNLQKTEYGAVRTDFIVNEIDKELNGSKCFGVGKLFLSEMFEYQMAESEYNGHTLKYETIDLNGQSFYNR